MKRIVLGIAQGVGVAAISCGIGFIAGLGAGLISAGTGIVVCTIAIAREASDA